MVIKIHKPSLDGILRRRKVALGEYFSSLGVETRKQLTVVLESLAGTYTISDKLQEEAYAWVTTLKTPVKKAAPKKKTAETKKAAKSEAKPEEVKPEEEKPSKETEDSSAKSSSTKKSSTTKKRTTRKKHTRKTKSSDDK